MSKEVALQQNPASQSRRLNSIALAALLIALGNIASRVLGLGRVSVIAYFFGRSLGVDAFAAAWTIPNTVYDLLINGAISAALVPIFSEFAEGDNHEFAKIVSGVVNLALIVLTVLITLLIWQAPLVVKFLVQSERPEFVAQTTFLVRLLLPTVLFMGLSGLMTATLYAKRIFLQPAFAGALFNAGIILGAVLLHKPLDVASLAIGTLIGAIGQVVFQAPALRGFHYQFALNLHHPAIRRILKLYAPVALGISFSIIGTLIDRWLASGLETALATMQYATTLIQFPLGLVAAAVSMAVLPTLSRQDAADDDKAFRRTLGMGLKVVLLLILPATAGLTALASNITALLFQRGAFVAHDTAATTTALLCYLPSLPAAAIDQLLIFAFYARKNTLLPNLVQGFAILIYLITALPLLYFTKLGFLALILGNSAQWIGHALLLFWLLHRTLPLRGLRLSEAFLKAGLASSLMALVVFALATGSLALGLPNWLCVLLAGGLGAILYLFLGMILRIEALDFFTQALKERIQR